MKWIQFVKAYAKDNNMSYRDALKDPRCNQLYRQQSSTTISKKGGKGGFVSEAIGMVKKAVNKQIDKVKHGRKYLVPPSLKDTLSKFENNIIVGATIYRHPVDSWIRQTLNVLGSNKIPFDKLFHLRLLLKLDNGKDIFIEKNERLNSGVGIGAKKEGLETQPIDNADIPKGMTFGQLVDNTKEYQGEKFLTYSSSSNNCQYFIMAILQANKFGNVSRYANFIKQDTESIFKNNPALRKIANTFTDLGGNMNVIINGQGNTKFKKGNIRLVPKSYSRTEPISTGGSSGLRPQTGFASKLKKQKLTKLDKEIYALLGK
jgi:hypothetical protein